MDWIRYLILGLLQGFTEILPISSSGHLLLVQAWLGIDQPGLGFEVLLHVGSLIAVVVYFRNRLWQLIQGFFRYILSRGKDHQGEFKMAFYLIIATIPAALAGVLLQDWIDEVFQSIVYVGIALWVTAILLYFSHHVKGTRPLAEMTPWDAFSIGLFQVAGILPGVSRSGSTLSGGLVRRFNQTEIAEFAFLLFIPIALGAAVLKLPDYFLQFSWTEFWPQFVGMIASSIMTYVSLAFFLQLIRRGKLIWFAYYTAFMGTLVIVVTLLI